MSARKIALSFLLLILLPGASTAAEPTTQSPAQAYAAFLAHNAQMGPVSIALRDQAVLNVPSGFAFLPEPIARKIMAKFGNDTNANFMGMVMPVNNTDWFSTLDYIPAGYIRDDDAKTWNADKLLADVRKNTEAANVEHAKQGIPALEVLGWVERPDYDSTAHRLIWSISARAKNATGGSKNIINYRTLALGREGYIEMTMVTDLSAIETEKPNAKLLLANLNFDAGKRYTDFNVSTDHVAEYGLAALIGGVVAHKLGFFALIAVFAAKFMKVIGLAIVGGFAAVRRFFGRGKKTETPSSKPLLNAPPPPPGPEQP